MGIAFVAPSADGQATLAGLHSPAAMAATVHQLRACVHSLPASDRFLLSLRFGIGGRPRKTDADVAARLGTTAAAVAAREVIAVRRLADAHRRGACKRAPVRATASSSAPPALSPLGAAGGSNRSGGGGISSGDVLAGLLILAALIVVAREFRKALFAPPPRR
jgi:hypothetical protein